MQAVHLVQAAGLCTLASAAGALLVIYLAADLGSVFGGWLPGFFLRRG